MACPRGRREMHLGQASGQLPVLFLGKRVITPTRPQPGLDVAERNSIVIAGQRSAEHRGRISLGEDQIGLPHLEGIRESAHGSRGQGRQRLVGSHQVEVVVSRQVEVCQCLVEQGSMLAGRENPYLIAGSATRQRMTGAILTTSGRVPTTHEIITVLISVEFDERAGNNRSGPGSSRGERQNRAPPHHRLVAVNSPAQALQVDWGTCGCVQVGDTTRKVSVFVAVLCNSRLMFIEFTLSQQKAESYRGLVHKLSFLGGSRRAIIFDNLRPSNRVVAPRARTSFGHKKRDRIT